MSIEYEVASEVLAAESGFLSQALMAENEKENPSPLLVKYYEARIKAIVDLEYDFISDDPKITNEILNRKRIFGCRGND
ncbi:MAG: hypothetical protein LBQ75_10090 [Zoogloeaceae bacterium]|nr:hypothetical protein [Zoogloeaceae bacterium]